jgi:hypothetical protein
LRQHHFNAIPSDSKTSTLARSHTDKGYYNQMSTSEDKRKALTHLDDACVRLQDGDPQGVHVVYQVFIGIININLA